MNTWTVIALCGLAAVAIAAQPEDILKTLRKGHPRLMLDAAEVARLKTLVESDELARRIYAKIKGDAKKALKAKPSIYEIPDGRRLLSVSRRVLDRVRALALVHLIEGDPTCVARAWAELEAAAKFKDWNPKHFLDTAEMTHALAIGYDWLYAEWSDGQRKLLCDAIVEKGLKPALRVYEPKHRGWATNVNNWNQVCNGGIGMGALAVADVEPKLSARILKHAIRSLPRAMGHYAPDGAGIEGVTYWHYGSRYNLVFLSALRSALGTDFGLSKIKGFGLSGDYQLYLSGADRMSFNFGDCGLTPLGTAQHFWIGREYDQPRHSWFRYSQLRESVSKAAVTDLLWLDPSARDFDVKSLPLDKYFRKAETATMRSAWGDPKALVLAIQAGRNERHNHRHVELGSFILEALGVRWAIDLGSERQTYMSHKHKFKRYDFYRTRAEGQNTLVMNPSKAPEQKIPVDAPIIEFESTPKQATAVVNLDDAYSAHAKRVRRRFTMVDRRSVTLSDEVEAAKPVDLWWFMHTRAAVAVDADGEGATLSQDGKTLRVEIAAPTDAKLEVLPAEPFPASPNPGIQANNKGCRKLAIHVKNVKKLTLTVNILPQW
ncbi:heparinase II/III family protein [bacterium]|nr:heparinase II/III family protein [bacterium]